ncbi:MAG: hypothetical protein UX07_C0046G0001, partial [Parcubacteria group bacterium GW2011_GWA2_45_30]
SALAGGLSVGLGYAGTAAPSNGLIIQGNVGIGNTSPTQELEIGSASISTGSGSVAIKQDGETDGFGIEASANDDFLLLYHDGTNSVLASTYSSTGSYTPLVLKTSSLAALTIGTDLTSTFAATTTHTYISNGLGFASAPSYTFTGDLNNGIWSSGSDTLNFSTNASERMRINSSGNVGIGTTSPATTLSVAGNTYLDSNVITYSSSTASNLTISYERSRFFHSILLPPLRQDPEP